MTTRAARPEYRLGDPLTARELQILALVAEGTPNGAIAKRLCISEETVKAHMYHAGLRSGFGSRAGLVGFAIRTRQLPVTVVGTPPPKFGYRHFDVLVRIARGLSNEEIGAELGLSFQTVKSRVRRVLELLGVERREAAVTAGFACGVLTLVPRQRVGS